MGCLNGKKTQILIAHQKERIDRTKKVRLADKKVRLETRGFCTYFLLLTTPYVMFEWKKTQILIAHQKQTIDRTKKVRLADKKSSASRQKSSASRQKKFG